MKVKPKLLFIGNHFSSPKFNSNVYQEIPLRIEGIGWKSIVTSRVEHKFLRLVDMLWTILINRNKYEIAIIDVFSGFAFIWAEYSTFLLRLIKKPFILILRGGNLPAFSLKHKARVNRLLNKANSVYSPSHYLKYELRRFRSDISVIPNPIDVAAYNFRVRSSVEPTLLWLRAFHQIYNPTLAVDVLSDLSKTYAAVKLIMVGPDKGDGSLQEVMKKAEELGVREKLLFPGQIPRNQVGEWLNKGDIFINTTNYDNTPVSVIEAMATGLCIVTTNAGGISYLVEHGKDGLIVPSNNPDAMTSAIIDILENLKLAETLSINARKKAEKLDWSIILPQWEKALHSVIPQREN